jgi:phosphoribosylglycinamide formyltransferase 1
VSGRVVVLVSGTGSNMLALADACERGNLDARVVAVAADRNCRGLAAASERGIAAELIRPSVYPARPQWDNALRDAVQSYRPDLVVSAGFMRILGPSFVDAFEGRLVNLHPSLLPAFPGAHAVRDALAAGVKVTGTTVHFVDHEIDHGPIVMQEPVRVLEGDTPETLHERIKTVEHRMIVAATGWLLQPNAAARRGAPDRIPTWT